MFFARALASAVCAILLLAGCAPSSSGGASAPAPVEFVAATYNIHIGKGMDKRLDLQRIADVITGAGAAVAGLQEVDRMTQRAGGVDQIAELARLTGMQAAYGKSIDLQGGEYGIAILVAGEILERRHELHPVGEEAERRSFLFVKARLKSSGRVIWIGNTHLGLVEADRRAQAAALLDAARGLDAPVVLLGDFNAEPDDGAAGVYTALSERFDDAWATAGRNAAASLAPLADSGIAAPEPYRGETWPANAPAKRIDYVWLRRGDPWSVRRCLVGATQASDHLPLFATLALE